jgi:S1-C subfamily serine protease
MKAVRTIAVLLAVAVLAAGMTSYAKTSRSGEDAWMGLYTQTVDHELAKAFNLKAEKGVVVNEVIENSPAEKAGLKEEDIILSANGTSIESADDLTDFVDHAKPGDKVTLDIIRDGKEMTLALTLGDRSDSAERVYNFRMPKIPSIPKSARAPMVFSFNTNDDGSYIGVSLTDLTEQLGDYFGVKNGNGVLVSDVEKESPAEKAGIKAGDVIVGIDGEKVADSRDVSDMIKDKKPGATASLDLIRDRKPVNLKVEVDQRKENNFFGYSEGNLKAPYVSVPRMHGLTFSDDNDQTADNEELEQQMEELRAKVKELKDRVASDKDLQEQLRQLREELKELKSKLK